jgi:hypothetical protein
MALVLVVLPAASSPADPGTTTLAALSRAARHAFGLL